MGVRQWGHGGVTVEPWGCDSGAMGVRQWGHRGVTVGLWGCDSGAMGGATVGP